MGNTIMTFNMPNYSGMLFNRGNTKTPFSTMIGGSRKSTDSTEFVVGQEYTTGDGEIPKISEEQSLTAPEPTSVTREQKTNVTQIFHESVSISYGKQSNMGKLSGINISGQTANPVNELDFQIAVKMEEIGRKIERTFIAGKFNKANADNQANQTRGMLEAVDEKNIVDLYGKPLRIWDVAEAMKLIYESNAPTAGLVLWLDPVSLFQLNADAEQNGLTIVPASREINGIKLSTILTPLGEITLGLGQFLTPGETLIFNPDVISVVEQFVPKKGNFFLEELAKKGAGESHQIFGQIGLDHGPGWYHGKIKGISTNFEKPLPGKRIYTVDPIETVVSEVTLEKAEIVESPKKSQATSLKVTYFGKPTTPASLAHAWEISNNPMSGFEAIGSATNATYTPQAGDVGKYIRCKVTATGTATGTVYSNAKKVLDA